MEKVNYVLNNLIKSELKAISAVIIKGENQIEYLTGSIPTNIALSLVASQAS